ncbi:hypothetical protein [Pyrinomonas methylaliphatogenes]|nr:hypothetical protein [Pyrinomonas methylaliphatogenes]
MSCSTPVSMLPSGAQLTLKDLFEAVSNPFFQKMRQQIRAKPEEQTSFSVEVGIERPVNVPEDVLRILRYDERNQTCLASGQSINGILATWFVASEVNLNDDDLPDLIVMAANPCLFGANVDPFWVFCATPQGHELVLSESATVLDVLDKRTNGYREIRLMRLSATEKIITVYRFDGRKYQARFSRVESIRQ